MIFNLSAYIQSIVGKKLDGKLIDRAFLTRDADDGEIVLRVHFSPDDYMDHEEIPLYTELEITD